MSIARVAKYAGVSTATVSRVLNDVPVVSETTVRNVRAALEALKYDPLEVKRGPRPGSRKIPTGRRVGMIAVMTVGLHREKLQFPATNAVVQAICRSAKQSGVRVLLDEMPDLHEMTSIIRDREVDGAVVFLADEAPLHVLAEMNQHVPIVWAMGGQAGPLPVDHVSENNIAVGYLAQQYLHDKGCRDLAFLTVLPQKRNARQRGQAFAGAAADQGLSARALVLSSDPIISGVYGADVIKRSSLPELIEAFAAMSPRPTGLFIDRDSTTTSVYPLLARHKIRPGREVTIISCDNEETALAALDPRPASIELGTTELGIRVVRRLLLRIENREEPPICIQAMPELRLGEDINGVALAR
jgi:DNA-binding LacI/PurR family transcriptional regulator